MLFSTNDFLEKNCMICGQELKSHMYICDFCYSLLIPVKKRLEKDLEFVDEAYSCFYYEKLIKNAMNEFKFANKRYYFKMFGEFLTDRIFELGLHQKADLIIPVPLYKKSKNKRGYNQAELMAKFVCEKTGLKIFDGLIKIRETEEQAMLDQLERKINLEDAFEVENFYEIENKNLLLIDDVITTGTTIDKCAEKLRPYAKKIYALSVSTPN